jgi:enoyl-CoA hydratase
MNDPTCVRAERIDSVLLVTINRPATKNAIDNETGRAIQSAMDLLDDDPTLFIGVLTGAGGNFSAGADLKERARGAWPEDHVRGGFGVIKRPPRKPLIAAVEGYAVGGGFEICLACDLVVAARNAKFGLPEVRHNLLATGGGLFRLPRRIPYHVAMELVLSGEFKEAAFLEKFGLVNRVVAPGTACAQALKWAKLLLVNGPTALSASKEILFESFSRYEGEDWRQQVEIENRLLSKEDRLEGLQAFAERRPPKWKGR